MFWSLVSWLWSILGGSASKQSANGKAVSSTTAEELSISKLIVYPIKSCAGIDLEQSAYNIAGLDYDRRWMIVDTDSQKLVTARTHSKICLIQPSLHLESQTLEIIVPHQGSFEIPLDAPQDAVRIDGLQVWGSYDLEGWIVSPAGSELQLALSSLLDSSVMLVQYDSSARRTLYHQQFLTDLFTGREDALDYPLEDCTTSFADGFPFLLATEASFDQMATWTQEAEACTSMDATELIQRYRPNIVIKGTSEAFVEDSWEELLLDGSQTLFPVIRCQRCPVPNVSPVTGEMSNERQPGTVVARFRSNVDKQVKGTCVGVNAITKARTGELRVGMHVKVVQKAQINTEDRLKGKYLRASDLWS